MHFKFCYGELNNVLATLFCEMMLDKGYLASTSVYVSAAHNIEMLDEYSFCIAEVFEKLSLLVNNKTLKDDLSLEVRSDSFGRIT